jgi:hypothetical protein
LGLDKTPDWERKFCATGRELCLFTLNSIEASGKTRKKNFTAMKREAAATARQTQIRRKSLEFSFSRVYDKEVSW